MNTDAFSFMRGTSHWTRVNAFGFYATCFLTIAFAVFVSSTQSFFITNVLGITKHVGDYVGTLGFADELVSIVACPFFGTLSDKIGTRPCTVFGLFLVGLCTILFSVSKNVYPDMLLIRMVFAFGASAAGSMMTAMLADISNSDFQWNLKIPFLSRNSDFDSIQEFDEEGGRRNGKLAAMVGVSTGLGAVFSVFVFLPLATSLDKSNTNPAKALKDAHYIIGSICLVATVGLFFILKSDPSKRIRSLIHLPFTSEEEDTEILGLEEDVKEPYFGLLKHGFTAALEDEKIALSYVAAFVSRTATVIGAVFIPLYVNTWYREHGVCKIVDGEEMKTGCPQAYIRASMITGISQTLSLVLAPLAGYAADRFGRRNVLLLASSFGIAGSLGFAVLNDPNGAGAIVFACLMGAGQIGVIICAMSLCTDKKRSFNGAIAGVHGLCGGIGVLFITKVGGFLSDEWDGTPFVIFAVFNFILVVATFAAKGWLSRFPVAKLSGLRQFSFSKLRSGGIRLPEDDAEEPGI